VTLPPPPPSPQVLYGGATRDQGANLPSKGHFVQPTIIAIDHSAAVVQHEAFVPCLYVMKVKSYEEAVAKNNSVSQGLSSSLFTRDMRNVFRWMGPQGSDCGLVNVNAGTSGERRWARATKSTVIVLLKITSNVTIIRPLI
jgi:acyl-CoA reductase-like NAD-dependent aldehyde dehydrogenase